MSDDIIIRIADEADLSEIVSFIELHFVNAEPSLTAYQLEDENNQLASSDEDDDKFMRECILNETSFVAHDMKNHQLVGVCIAGKIGPNEHEESLKIANVVNDRKFADILKFLAFIEERADVCNRLCVPESLHLHMISVHEDYYGRGIAGKLFKAYYENAINKKYLALSIDCTSFYTSRIAERYNMELLSTVTYDEYNEFVGTKVFVPKEPHTVVRSYGIKLEKKLSCDF
jgi:GNAT superfamily N-acetyltransferase